MPLSDPSHRPWVLDQLRQACGGDLGRIRSVVDAGAGLGGWEGFLKPWLTGARWTAIEIWAPYTDRFLLRHRYHQVITADLADLDPFPPADLIIFGDVLEHMPADRAAAVWEKARAAGWRLVLGIPVRCYPQGEDQGNPYEAHVSTWTTGSVLATFGGIYAHQANPDTGAFIAEGQAAL